MHHLEPRCTARSLVKARAQATADFRPSLALRALIRSAQPRNFAGSAVTYLMCVRRHVYVIASFRSAVSIIAGYEYSPGSVSRSSDLRPRLPVVGRAGEAQRRSQQRHRIVDQEHVPVLRLHHVDPRTGIRQFGRLRGRERLSAVAGFRAADLPRVPRIAPARRPSRLRRRRASAESGCVRPSR